VIANFILTAGLTNNQHERPIYRGTVYK